VAYPDGGDGYYSSEVYTSPAPAYYAGGSSYYSNGGVTIRPRHGITRRLRATTSQPRAITRNRGSINRPRYYQPSRADYRAYQNRGWDGRNRGDWDNDHRGGRNHNHDDRGDHNGRGNHDGRGDHR
jgi:hypothetical protein